MSATAHDQLLEEAFQLWGRTMVRTDPSRLESWAGLGLTLTQLRVLFILRDNPNLTAGALAEGLAVTPPTLTRIMDRLVRHDLVRRLVDDEDRRCVCHSLTERGLETVEEIARTGRAFLYDVLRRLSREQLERLVAGLRDLLEATEAAQRAGVKP